MHLRAIKLRGFKSFPERVEVRLEPGVAVVVGPNGSGNSNVADALLWASGSLSPHELRAEKPDDVLFAGSPGHPPAGDASLSPARIHIETSASRMMTYPMTIRVKSPSKASGTPAASTRTPARVR